MLNASAQHSTLRFQDEPFMLDHQSILIVPFESKMYLSDVNRDIGQYNQLSSQEIIDRFTNALDQSLYYKFKERCKVSSFYTLDDDSSKAALSYIYQNIELEYELVALTEEKTKAEKLKSKFKKKEDPTYDRGGIENGQLVTKSDPRERYMKAVVRDQKMLDSVHLNFNNEFFLFLNELDFKNVYGDALAMQNMEYNRELKVHFTLYKKDGTILTTGISSTLVPATENDINVITSTYFPILASNIFDALFEDEDTSAKKSNLPWK
jgi:hypothetical protein